MTQCRIAAVFFDAAGTLITLRESVGSGYAAIAEPFGLCLDPAAVEEQFRAQWKALPPPNPGSPLPDGGIGWWRTLVFSVLDALGCSRLPADLRESYFQALYAHYAEPGRWIAYPEVPSVLESLRQIRPDLVLAVVSNFDSRLRAILKGLELDRFFDDIVISTEIGYSKPARGLFDEARRRFGLPAGDCLHVGDDPREDWEGARDAGLRVLQLARPDTDLTKLLQGAADAAWRLM